MAITRFFYGFPEGDRRCASWQLILLSISLVAHPSHLKIVYDPLNSANEFDAKTSNFL